MESQTAGWKDGPKDKQMDKTDENYVSLLHTWYTRGLFICLCWVFTAQSTQWCHVERGQFT